MSEPSSPARRAGGGHARGNIGARAKRNALEVEVVERAGGWTALGPLAGKIREAALATSSAARADGADCTGSVVIALSDAAEVRSLNAAYRGKDSPTNVLSFPVAASLRSSDPSRPLGDVILSFETVVAEARERGVSAVDHLQHLVVHGLLHLAGYDHEADAEAARMERLESRVMLSLGVSDPYVVD